MRGHTPGLSKWGPIVDRHGAFGETQALRAVLGSSSPASAGVLPAQSLYGAYSDRLVVHGKEKVYGSIP